ncbi:hypothetical protein IJ00_12965 [Calothrix sp. 336/3]|nr:hypothetical protein IJ00_12965 [Calothrix sp. 336/3]
MNSFLNNLLCLRSVEYLIFDTDFQIKTISPGMKEFVYHQGDIQVGKDVRHGFPELVGMEDIIMDICQKKLDKWELNAVARFREDNSTNYIQICLTRNIKNNNFFDEVILIVEDVTEKIQLEKSLVQGVNEAHLLLSTIAASKEYIDQIISSMADALVVTNLTGKIQTANAASQKLLEYTEAELIGQKFANIIPDFKIVYNQEVETYCLSKSGIKIPISLSCSFVKTDIKTFQGYIYIIRDIRERKQAELAKQEFIAMMNHEIRTPIASVTGITNLLLNTTLTEEQRDFINTINNSNQHLLRIINDILDFYKIESGKLELEIHPFSLKSCLDDCIKLLENSAKSKNLSLILTFADDIDITIFSDIVRVKQILVNLLSNAIKFTDVGSIEISVQIRPGNDKGKEPQELIFAVKDTGIGIPSDRLHRLFQSFSQVNPSTTREYGGTGLGLAICKQLCERMGGAIWVDSEEGVGTTFYFTIAAPIIQKKIETQKVKPETKATDEVIDAQMAKTHPLRILLADDNLVNQRIICLTLQRMGYKADLASNGVEVLDALRSQSYDVILMDVRMPKMDGLEATQKIRQELASSDRPWIIALTANAMFNDRETCLAAGMNDYLAKPIRIPELVAALKNVPLTTKEENHPNPSYRPDCVDMNTLDELLQIAKFNSSGNPESFVIEVIDTYLEDGTSLLANMHKARNKKDYQSLENMAHKLYSSSATLGAHQLASVCKQLEKNAKKEPAENISGLVYQLETEYQQVEQALSHFKKKYMQKH